MPGTYSTRMRRGSAQDGRRVGSVSLAHASRLGCLSYSRQSVHTAALIKDATADGGLVLARASSA